MNEPSPAVAAGHICLDIMPDLSQLPPGDFLVRLKPGHLIQVGGAILSTGGPVSNTGLALHRLGVPTQLICKVGADPLGQIVHSIIQAHSPELTAGINFVEGETTSYSIIINPLEVDRIFLHHPGANDTFDTSNVNFEMLNQSALFHFGYPPIMQKFYQNGGQELVNLFSRAKRTNITTSLDMSYPDPASEGGKADWGAILQACLAHVDIFMPSIEELLYMLDRPYHDRLVTRGTLLEQVTPSLLSSLSTRLLEMGAGIVGIKLGERGLYLRTGSTGRLAEMGKALPENLDAWSDKELWTPCFKVNVVGTTGSGDATISGFLSAFLRNFSPQEAINTAVAVGACNVEAGDALTGLLGWNETQERIIAGWEHLPLQLNDPAWQWDDQFQLWCRSSMNHHR